MRRCFFSILLFTPFVLLSQNPILIFDNNFDLKIIKSNLKPSVNLQTDIEFYIDTLILLNRIEDAQNLFSIELENGFYNDKYFIDYTYNLFDDKVKYEYYKGEMIKLYARKNHFDSTLCQQIASAYIADQSLRFLLLHLIALKLNHNDLDSFKVEIAKQDSINRLMLVKIFDNIGYPSTEKLGWKLEDASFFLYQHFPEATQKKYFPLIYMYAKKELVEMAIDRILINEGKKQLYGSQFNFNSQKVYETEKNEKKRKLLMQHVFKIKF